jgi:RecA/RadA recombinase
MSIQASNLTSVLPSYLNPLLDLNVDSSTVSTVLLVILLLIIFSTIFILIANYLRLKRAIKDKYVFIEVKPPYKSLQSAFSTNQLFGVIHSLERHASLIDKLLKIKHTISCELVSTKEEGIRYILRIPKDDVAAIKKSLLAYLSSIEIKEVEDYLPVSTQELINSSWRIGEFKLSKSYVIPLKDHTLLEEYDPIAYITSHMTKLQPQEMVVLQVIFSPVISSTHANVISHIHKLRELLNNNLDISKNLDSGISVREGLRHSFEFILRIFLNLLLLPLEILVSFMGNSSRDDSPLKLLLKTKQKTIGELGEAKKQLHQKVAAKINEPLFETSLRLFIKGNDDQTIGSRFAGIQSSLDNFSTTNQELKLKRSLVPMQWKMIRQLEYFKLNHRLLSYISNPILSLTELSSLYHLPFTATTKTEDLINTKSPQLPPPLSLKKSAIKLDNVFAKNIYSGVETPIGLTLEERRRHLYVIGATGTGKTTLLTHMIYNDLSNGKGVAVLDPHGDLSERLLAIVPEKRANEVVYFNPYDTKHPIGLNILELTPNIDDDEKQREKDLITSSVVSIFYKLYPPRYMGPRMEHILRNTILTALEQPESTLMTVYELLTNKNLRNQAVSRLPEGILKDFWKEEFEGLGSNQKAEQISPITNKLGRFLTASMTANILNQTKSTLNLEEIMNNGQILICDLSKGKIGEDVSAFLGSIITAKLQLAALKRVHIPQNERKDFFLYIDEFQNFATKSFAELLSEARKYRLNVVLAHQTVSQIEDRDFLQIILANVGTVIVFRTSSPLDEETILPILLPQVNKHEISNLPSYHFYIKINALEPQDAFTGEIDDFTLLGNQTIKQQVVNSSRDLFGLKPATINKNRKIVPSKKPSDKTVKRVKVI